jgi:hypothetical protein
VSVYDVATQDLVRTLQTDEAGAYLALLPRGTYAIQFEAPSGSGLMTEWWDNALSPQAARGVSVAAGETSVADALLSSGATITGRVKATIDGTLQGVPDLIVVAYRAVPVARGWTSGSGLGEVVATTLTSARGDYEFAGLPAGSYILAYQADGLGNGYSTQYSGGSFTSTEADQFRVSTNEVLTGKNITLTTESSTLAGTVKGLVGTTLTPLMGVRVNVQGPGSFEYAVTDAKTTASRAWPPASTR